jgi:drug/metabolite transporter (DMT)-like permease
VGSAIALALFYMLVRETSPVFASMVTYFVPVLATVWGIADGERLTTSMILSVIVILAGVYLINRPGLRQRIRTLAQNMLHLL